MIGVTPDSNIYISALEFGGAGGRLLWMARAGTIRIDTSNAILAETFGVLRDKFGWQGYQLHFGEEALRRLARVVEPAQILEVTDDPDENRVLECAVEAGSQFIITYDKDLLRLGSYADIPILRPEDFLQRPG